MNTNLYLNDLLLGQVDFQIIDESMGAIGGPLVYNSTYLGLRDQIQQACERKGIANSDDFNFSVWVDSKTKLNPEGGIGITDLKDIEEVYVEVAGLGEEVINFFR